MYVKMI